jgi:hypothetical protein
MWPTHGSDCETILPDYIYIPTFFILLTIVSFICCCFNCRMTWFMINKHKFKPNAASLSSALITIAMGSETCRHLYFFLRCIGFFVERNHEKVNTGTTAFSMVCVTASLATVSLAWMAIAKKTRHMQQSTKKEANHYRSLTFWSRILLIVFLSILVITIIVLWVIEKLQYMAAVALIDQLLLFPLLYFGGRMLRQMLPPPKAGQVDLSALMIDFHKKFAFSLLLNLTCCLVLARGIWAMYNFNPADYDGDTWKGYKWVSLYITFATVGVSVAIQVVGFIMFSFFGKVSGFDKMQQENKEKSRVASRTAANAAAAAAATAAATHAEKNPMRSTSPKGTKRTSQKAPSKEEESGTWSAVNFDGYAGPAAHSHGHGKKGGFGANYKKSVHANAKNEPHQKMVLQHMVTSDWKAEPRGEGAGGDERDSRGNIVSEL